MVVIGSRHVPRSWALVAVAAPLPLVALAVAFGWPWWVAIVPLAGIVAVSAELVGIAAGTLTALVATVGVILVVERADHPDHPRNALELVAMATLLLVAVLFGTDRTVS